MPERSVGSTTEDLAPAGSDQAGSASIESTGSRGSNDQLPKSTEIAEPAGPAQTPFVVKHDPPESATTEQTKQIVALEARKETKASTSSTPATQDTEAETVRIQEVNYVVPEPWAGNRVRVPYDTAENLVLIPTELTLNGMEIALRKEALVQLERMAAAARKDGIRLQVDSGYRSATYQHEIYVRRMTDGQSFERVARFTAPPGYSGHALGTVVDFHPSKSGFQQTRAYQWLQQHARNYGFYETYAKGNSFGVAWEPWHWEYRLKEKPLTVASLKNKAKTPAGEAVQTKANQIPMDGEQTDNDVKKKEADNQ
ncbi:MAG: D-alanyl-D-alanine carboxypeptidase family protein [Desulfobulbaceae bacterium]|nr:D-alanyl-D-alanine carboxypeptidase family protein [Desulfobulbaceae bacterium]